MGSNNIDALSVMVFEDDQQKEAYENAVGMVEDDKGRELSDGEVIETLSKAYTGRL